MRKNYHKRTPLQRLERDAATIQRYSAIDYQNARLALAYAHHSKDAAILYQREAAKNSQRARAYLFSALTLAKRSR